MPPWKARSLILIGAIILLGSTGFLNALLINPAFGITITLHDHFTINDTLNATAPELQFNLGHINHVTVTDFTTSAPVTLTITDETSTTHFTLDHTATGSTISFTWPNTPYPYLPPTANLTLTLSTQEPADVTITLTITTHTITINPILRYLLPNLAILALCTAISLIVIGTRNLYNPE